MYIPTLSAPDSAPAPEAPGLGDEILAALAETPLAETYAELQYGASAADVLELDDLPTLIDDSLASLSQHVVDRVAAVLPYPAMPAASLGILQAGAPHVHLLPVPRPAPLTVGAIALGVCQSVLLHGIPAARAGNVGFLSCPTVAPVFEITTGSSSVYIGGGRAARFGDLTVHGGAPGKAVKKLVPALAEICFDVGRKGAATFLHTDEAIDAAEGRSQLLGAAARGHWARAAGAAAAPPVQEGSASAAALASEARHRAADAATATATAAGVGKRRILEAAQAIADGLASAAKAAMALDPAKPASRGAIILGHPDVLIGGFPTPTIELSVGGLKKLRPGALAPGIRDGWARTKLELRSGGAWLPARLREALPRGLRAVTGHPIDVVGGAVLTEATDAVLRGPWPLVVRRYYSSAWADRPGPLGPGWSLSLDLAIWVEGRYLVYRTDDGRELTYALEGAGDPPEAAAGLMIVDPANGLRLSASAGGRWRVVRAEGGEVELAPIPGDPAPFAQIARAVALRGPEGQRIELLYDPSARLVGARQVGGRTLGLRWARVAGGDRLAALTLPDPAGEGAREHVRYERSAAGDLAAVIDAEGGRQRFAYDDHRLVEEILADGRRFSFAYDGPGAEARGVRTWGEGGVYARTLTYDPIRRRTVIVDGEGQTTIAEADGHGRLAALTTGGGEVWRFLYDEYGRRCADIDPLGAIVRRRFDELGRCVEVIEGDGTTWSYDHDRSGRLCLAVDPLGGRWRWHHDPHGRLVARVDASGATTEIDHAPDGATTITDPEGERRRITWGPEGEVEAIVDGLGRRWEYVHDRRGRLVAARDPAGGSQRFTYDRADRLIAAEAPGGVLRRYLRDAGGRVTRIAIDADDEGSVIDMTYGPCGEISSVVADGRALSYAHDSEGRLVAITSGAGSHTIERSPSGAVIGETTLDGRRVRLRRDACGRVIARVESGGRTTAYTRDERGRVTEIAYADGAHERFIYRGDGAMILARRDEAGWSSCVELVRDACGRVVGELDGGRWIAVDRDRCGRRRRLRSSEGITTIYRRDEAGAPVDVAIAGQGGRWSARLVRDDLGREVERRLPGAVTARWRRRPDGRPLNQTIAADSGADPRAPALGRVYTWTAGGRLLAITSDGRWTPAARAPKAAPSPLARAGAEVVATEPPGPQRVACESDALGRVTLRRGPEGLVLRLGWDAADRLREVREGDGAPMVYRYDALGRRVEAIHGEHAVSWLWDGDRPLHEEHRGAGRTLTKRTWLFDDDSFAPMAALIDGRFYGVISDHLGCPLVALADDGGVAWRAPSPAAGLAGVGVGGIELPFGQPGHQRDPASGLLYCRHRHVDPSSGRFLSPDPSGLAGGLDPFAGVDDPWTMIDPLGLRGEVAHRPAPTPGIAGATELGAHTRGRAEDGPLGPVDVDDVRPPGAPELPRTPSVTLVTLVADGDPRGGALLERRAIEPPLRASCADP